MDGYKQALNLFNELDYTPEAWQAGIRQVPRIYLSEITDRWSKVTVREIDVTLKKRIFFRAIGPLALRSNELILQERDRLQLLAKATATATDPSFLPALAERYGLTTEDMSREELITELLLRVDIVPPSLILAQAAEESGWGTSRFAFTGNALFGQWSWDGNGIKPKEQRSGKGDYRIAAFDSPLQSVQAHARNLNSHRAYSDFRRERARMRATDRPISGTELAGTLTRYSERGVEYVRTLRSIMSFNKLEPVDNAYLADAQAIVLVQSGADLK